MSKAIWLIKIPIKTYQLFVSPFMTRNCRFHPTCSAYSLEAFEVHGLIYGSWLSFKRILKCNPWGGHGLDPVPPKNDKDSF